MTLIKAALSVWPFPSPPLDNGVEDGIFWATVEGPMAGVNGYVLVPAEGHPWSKAFPEDEHGSDRFHEFLDVHGGVTYYDHANGTKGIWIGFDTCHAYDVWPPEYDRHGVTKLHESQYSIYWTPAMVVEEAKDLARQIAGIGKCANTTGQ